MGSLCGANAAAGMHLTHRAEDIAVGRKRLEILECTEPASYWRANDARTENAQGGTHRIHSLSSRRRRRDGIPSPEWMCPSSFVVACNLKLDHVLLSLVFRRREAHNTGLGARFPSTKPTYGAPAKMITKHRSWSSSASTLVGSGSRDMFGSAISLFPVRITRERPSAWLDVVETGLSDEERGFPFRRRQPRPQPFSGAAPLRLAEAPATNHLSVEPEEVPSAPTPTPTAPVSIWLLPPPPPSPSIRIVVLKL
ncbi:hypothetical protein HMN09_01174100 [Mycena chlorophos]|uniref:Uncharacterized protein n=1 Tax=Mycena chlorophos TaxID=658473 RepID=A0A8H6VZF9_MYCCL|nr:hypothetical protein HMN09_01174100 [Mycena chlorophos]